MAQVERSINGELYGWSNIRVNLLGRNLVGIKGIDYDDSDEIKGVKGRGSKDIGFVQGNYQAAGKLTLEMSEVESLNASLPRGMRIQEIRPFDIVVAYRNDDQRLVTHVLKNCKIMKQNRTAKAGEVKELEVDLPLYIGEIDWNA
jgi:hypothetical protein